MTEDDVRQRRSTRPLESTTGTDYTERLRERSSARWKQVLNVQAPYQRHVRRLDLGRTIDVGCGIGRNLSALDEGSIGVDHNPSSIDEARDRGFEAYTDEEFFASTELTSRPWRSLLIAHVAEHLTPEDARSIFASYVALLPSGGRVAFITPQERGHRTGETHITFMDFPALRSLSDDLGLRFVRAYSFPLPRFTGTVFNYNEFVTLAVKP